ncbi:Hypothetical protein NTJ_08425 [Nesidiocoris tenuis]|nr:Hypothetical protein NTJ_08425 [Nesidiocoris tenuis]
MGSCEKFIITPENFMLRPEAAETTGSIKNTPAAAPVLGAGAQYIKCAVTFCNNYFDGLRTEFAGVSHFSFPKDPQLREEWMAVVDPPAHLDIEAARVCSAHFLKSDMYNTDSGRPALRAEAVPRKGLIPLKTPVPVKRKTGCYSVPAGGVRSAEVAWSNSTPDQSVLLPRIASVHSMSTSITRIANHASTPMRRTRWSAYMSKLIANANPDPENGLINIPATIKIPPKIAVVDLASNDDSPSSSHRTSAMKNIHFNGSTASGASTSRRKRARRSNMNDEDEWLPPSGVKVHSSDEVDQDTDDTHSLVGKVKLRNIIKPNGVHPLSNASLLVDWSFFKSLLPYMRKMNSDQRNYLKTFILNSLNAKIYPSTSM